MKKLIIDVCTKSVFCSSNRIFKEIDGVYTQYFAKYFERKSRTQTKLNKTEKLWYLFLCIVWGPVRKASGEVIFRGYRILRCLPIHFWDFPNFGWFSNILSLKFSVRRWCSLYVRKIDLVIDTMLFYLWLITELILNLLILSNF